MMRWSLMIVLSLSMGFAIAQKPKAKLKTKFSYEFQREDGTNASAVAWNPDQEIYATVIAGNTSFPFETFDRNGEVLEQSEATFDWRGLWYNPKTKRFEGNGAGEEGWVAANADDNGSLEDVESLQSGQYQPDFQSVGTFDYLTNKVAFFNFENISLDFYPYGDPTNIESVELDIDAGDVENFNSTTVGFTGKSGYEFVLLDFNNGKLVFFDRQGKQTATSKFAKDAVLSDMFCFSFSNGHAFLYDKDARIWNAYKVF
jgi:hypothetical protein